MKILYMMHVDWGWIKQRPHFLAEELTKKNDVFLFYFPSFQKKINLENNNAFKCCKSIFRLPYSRRIKILHYVSILINRLFFRIFIRKNKIDYIWFCGPSMVPYLSIKRNTKFIYDCMDDHLSFKLSKKQASLIQKRERWLCNNSTYIFCSSDSLISKIRSRYDIKENNIFLIRNAFNGKIINPKSNIVGKKNKNNEFHVAYVGTVSSWFDLELLKTASSHFGNVFFDIYGPSEIDCSEGCGKIIFHGPISHSDIYKKIESADALMMPFVLNELIESVDPVKLYEYINFEKNIISVRYAEILRFEKFVFFYNGTNQFLEILKKLISDNTLKYTHNDKTDFLINNSWEQRAMEIERIISKREA